MNIHARGRGARRRVSKIEKERVQLHQNGQPILVYVEDLGELRQVWKFRPKPSLGIVRPYDSNVSAVNWGSGRRDWIDPGHATEGGVTGLIFVALLVSFRRRFPRCRAVIAYL